MSQALHNMILEQKERIDVLEKIVREGYESEAEARLKKLEEKYHMLNARLTKYKVD